MPDELPRKLPPKRAVDHEIELVPGTKPPARAPYRMTQPELVELRKQVKDMLESGIIIPTKSPYGAPVLFQKKADGSLRMCCDYRALNKITVKNKYPIPLVADCFDRLSQAKYFYKDRLEVGLLAAEPWPHVEHSRFWRDSVSTSYMQRCRSARLLRRLSASWGTFGREDIRMDPKKVQAIEEWQPPSDVHDLRSLLGLANYYRRFVKDYSKIARP
ncbi:UNVERIFIED_CONTAM: RNA-directed DNA polymerase [Sesamum radiatum]|uniref:RNA-directed DNA polymerase n=1 Tax=Sesamum radiatum TaxID=300843 RepID=A0AAW2S019_SESRA